MSVQNICPESRISALHPALQLAAENGGIVTSQLAAEAGISRSSLAHLVATGRLTRVERGVFRVPGCWDDEFFLLQHRYRKGIFCLGSALYLLDLTDRTPARFHLTFPQGYNYSQAARSMPGGVLCHTTQPEWYHLGICTVQSPSGHDIRIYCAERTICDILRPRNAVDSQIVVDALRGYLGNRQNRNIPRLCQYVGILRVEKRLQSYLEMLL